MTDQAASAPAHIPVLLAEVVAALQPGPGQTMLDATFGAGGYSSALLDAGARVIALDRDPSAARFAAPLIETGRFELVEARFSQLASVLDERDLVPCDGIVFDIGVSSMQLDEADRGFSFMRDGPLDMRMGGDGPTAADIVNFTEASALSRMFWVYGEERAARRITAFLVRRRAETPFATTLDLAETVERAVGGRKGAPTHPATKVFQALRIVVNEELAELEAGLEAAEAVLKPGGRLAVVTFHSLEDRIVKAFFTERAGRLPGGSRHLPPVQQAKAPTFELVFNGARAPSDAELAVNPRSRSAKLRAGIRTAAPAWGAAA
jgi:16S rRNA (cytosine1402-N4)-methyltransferase